MNEQLVVKYIKTKNKVRKIVTYKEDGELRRYHEAVVKFLKENTDNSIFAKAYVPRASIYKNAEAHMYNDVFIKMDIKDFFANLNHKYLVRCLYHEINKNTKISKRECYDVVKKCSVSEKGLPLGLVTSPALANLYMKEFDGLLYGKIKSMGFKNPIYTRYADDMVISFQRENEYEDKIKLLQDEVRMLLRKFCLSVNEKKTEIFDLEKSNHVRITGISVTKDADNYRHISVGKKLKNELFWEAINIYDQKITDYAQLAHLKGIYSFVLSIEKQGIENAFSDNMRRLICERGFDNLTQMINSLGKDAIEDTL